MVQAGRGRPGWSLSGYEVEELIGIGATGEVWRGRELASGRLVALKRLTGAGSGGQPEGRDRLRREAALLAGVTSPHLVRLRTVVTTGDGLVLVLDLATGGSLASLLGVRRTLPAGEVVAVAAPVAEALADVHAAGIVHGDVSPANVLLTADGRPLLSDLGVARMVHERAAAAVTIRYADPAVLAGGDVDPAADVYALAAVCHAALTGAPPYPGDDVEEILRAVAAGRRLPLPIAVPGLPGGLADAVEAALALEPAQRPDAATLAAGLRAACPPARLRLA
ncbi:MAG: serine/threonine-protein kinase, partial [Frankiaceae bacterium]